MANTDELLAKARERLEKKNSQTSQPRRIQRTGPTRPWQENLETNNKTSSVGISETKSTTPLSKPVVETIELKTEKLSVTIPQQANQEVAVVAENSELDPCLKVTKDSQSGDNKTPSTHMPNFSPEALNESPTLRNNSATITEQKENNLGTSSATVANLLRNNYGTISKQISNNSATISNNSVTQQRLNRNDSGTNSVTSSAIEPEQFRNNINPPHVNRLSGHKLKIVETIFDFCQERGALNSGPISREVFTSRTSINGEVIRTTTIRLQNEGYIEILESKRGSGGWTIYGLNPLTHTQILSGLHKKITATPEQLRNNSVTNSVTDSGTKAPYSSSSFNNLNTNITTEGSFAERIEIPHDLVRTGIKLANILPHVKTEEDLERVNESLQAYAFDFNLKGTVKTGVFYGVIKSGQYYLSDAYTLEMEKERQKQAMAAKARTELKNFEQVQVPATSKAEIEFEEKYCESFADDLLNKMPATSQSTMKLLAANGIHFPPFKSALKNFFVQNQELDVTSEQPEAIG